MAPWVIRQRALPAGDCQLPPDLHPVIRRVMLARGVKCPQSLQLQMADMLSPDTLSGIEPAADLLAEAIISERSILVVGDFDADGATGAALAVLALQAMGCRQIDF